MEIQRTAFLVFMMLTSFIARPASAQSTAFPESMIAGNPTAKDFQLVTNQNHAVILIDDQDYPTVILCANLFRDDVERVTGYKPLIVTHPTEAISFCVIIGSIEKSRIIKKLISEKRLMVYPTRHGHAGSNRPIRARPKRTSSLFRHL